MLVYIPPILTIQRGAWLEYNSYRELISPIFMYKFVRKVMGMTMARWGTWFHVYHPEQYTAMSLLKFGIA